MTSRTQYWLHLFPAECAAALLPDHVVHRRRVPAAFAWLEASKARGAKPKALSSDCIALLTIDPLANAAADHVLFSVAVSADSRLAELWFPNLGTASGFVEPGSVSHRHRSRPFPLARSFVHRMNLQSRDEWRHALRRKLVPDDIPSRPDRLYRHSGWLGWADFFGVEKLSRRKGYADFAEARTFLRNLNLPYGGKHGYLHYRAGQFSYLPGCPKHFPSHPERTFADHWSSWEDFLGKPPRVRRIRNVAPFEEARAYIRTLGLKSAQEYQLWRVGRLPGFAPRPDNIPSNPQVTYQSRGWRGYSDFIGTAQPSPPQLAASSK